MAFIFTVFGGIGDAANIAVAFLVEATDLPAGMLAGRDLNAKSASARIDGDAAAFACAPVPDDWVRQCRRCGQGHGGDGDCQKCMFHDVLPVRLRSRDQGISIVDENVKVNAFSVLLVASVHERLARIFLAIAQYLFFPLSCSRLANTFGAVSSMQARIPLLSMKNSHLAP